jgi:phytoene dehydrogenase-like protein
VSSTYFDIVVLGTELGPLTCAALLSKRGFRVLVLGQQTDRADYRVGSFRLPRRPFLFSGGRGPLACRVFAELGLQQSLRRLAGPKAPLQIAVPGHRFDVSAEPGVLQREVEREFPALSTAVTEFRRSIDVRMQRSDALLAQDQALGFATSLAQRPPPSGSFARHVLAPARLLGRKSPRAPEEALLAGIPAAHPFRWSVLLPSAFASYSDPDALTDAQLARLFATSTHSGVVVQGGLAALCGLLAEKVRMHGGQLRSPERASQIVVERASVRGVQLLGSGEVIGTGAVVAGIDVDALQRLLSERQAVDAWFGWAGEPQPSLYRYTLNVVVRTQALPAGIERDVFLVRRPTERVWGDNAMHVEVSALDREHSLLCCETLMPARTAAERELALDGARERLLAALGELIPFLDPHLVLLDSPHDGRKPWGRPLLDVQLAPAERRGLPTLPRVHRYDAAGELCALSVSTPIKGLLLCNAQVAPSLGVEGELLAASAAAHVARRAERSREWLRTRLWTKVDD